MKEKHHYVVLLRDVSHVCPQPQKPAWENVLWALKSTNHQYFLERKDHCTPNPKPLPNCEAWGKHQHCFGALGPGHVLCHNHLKNKRFKTASVHFTRDC